MIVLKLCESPKLLKNSSVYHIDFNLRSSDDGYTDFYTYVRKIVLVLKAIKTSESPSLDL